jgi:type VI secretion system protein ImpK
MSMAAPQRSLRNANHLEERADTRHPAENLALLYQGLLTGIVRLQSRREHIADAESFRRRTKSALKEVERDAAALGYDAVDISETHFAVVAFLDSVVLNSTEPVRAEWQRQSLQEELFGQADAGVVFFEKLERLRSRRDSQQLADILEVYLLCLLLGFEGRYSGGLQGELYSITDRVMTRIDDIRGRARRISPAGVLAAASAAPEAPLETRDPGRYRLIIVAAIIITIICFLALRFHLVLTSDQIRARIF